MTTFADNIQTGLEALTSGQSSISGCNYSRSFDFTGANASTQQFVFPVGTMNLDAKLFILAQGSAATSDKITVSAAGQDFHTFTSFGSASGIVRQTTVGLGTLTSIASACANLSQTAEVSAAVTIASVDIAASYRLQLSFTRARNTFST